MIMGDGEQACSRETLHGRTLQTRLRSSWRSTKAGVGEAGTKGSGRTGIGLSQVTGPRPPTCKEDPEDNERAAEGGHHITGNHKVALRR
jgi:hypothetical protein